MKKKTLYKFMILVLCGALMVLSFTACTKEEPAEPPEEPEQEEPAEPETEPTEPAEEPEEPETPPEEGSPDRPAEDARDHKAEITGEFAIDTEVEDGVRQEENLYTITKGGTYALSGRLQEGRILIDAADEKVTLLLTGASIRSSQNAPILAAAADKLTIETAEGAYSEIIDDRQRRAADAEEDPENAKAAEITGKGAVYAKCDLKLCGTGYLAVSAGYDNGIHTVDDLTAEDICLSVTAPNSAIKGKDSVTVKSGEYVLISSGGDGIKTEATDVTSKGKQRGTLTIGGGVLDIYAACDGLDASYDAVIEGEPVIHILTDTYSSYTGEVMAGDLEADFYYILSYGDYDDDCRYAAYFYNEGQEGVWKEALYETDVYGGVTRYCGLKLSVPSGYSNVAFYVFESGDFSTEEYLAAGEGVAFDTAMNGYLVSGIADGVLSGDYVNLSTGSEAATYSRKGIKADNLVSIGGGLITVKSTDDGVHTNAGDVLENGTTGIGSIEISGGTLTVTTEDDAVHADNTLTISDGTVKVLNAYEGLEANVIKISGGEIDVFAADDGINAAGEITKPLLNVSGGSLTVRTASGDTDAIDCNGDYMQTGGFVLVLGGSSSGMMSGSIDADGTVSVTGGTCIALGGICEVPSGEKDCNMAAATTIDFGAGEYEIKNSSGETAVSFRVPTGTYRAGWFASDAFETGETYVLEKDGGEIFRWTQDAQSAGDAVQGGFGPGGPGGPEGGPQKP